MRLLVSGWLSIDFGRGTAKLAHGLITGLLEFSKALARHHGGARRSCWQLGPAGFEELAATRAAFKGLCWRVSYLDARKTVTTPTQATLDTRMGRFEHQA